MSESLISRATLIAFREYLNGWSLREIRDAFDGAEVAADLTFVPSTVPGERRTLVEQHYRTLKLTDVDDARRLLRAFERVMRGAASRADSSAAERGALEGLKRALRSEGLAFERDGITPATVETKRIFGTSLANSISETTRRNIADAFTIGGLSWSGRMDECEFLGRLFDLKALPSHDHRFTTLDEDIFQHRFRNADWSDDWVFTDSRLNLSRCPDEQYLRFLTEVVHPAVRRAEEDVEPLLSMINGHLAHDGWLLAPVRTEGGRPIYAARRRIVADVVFAPDANHRAVLNSTYVEDLSVKCDARLAMGDLDGAVTAARTLVESVLREIELNLAGAPGDYAGDLQRQYKAVTKRMRLDEDRTDLDEQYKLVVRGLVQSINGIAPLRNKISDAHARAKKPAVHHARLAVNAAKTIASFLVESFAEQKARGLIVAPGAVVT